MLRAHRINALHDAHQDDPTFGYRYLPDEARRAGWRMSRSTNSGITRTGDDTVHVMGGPNLIVEDLASVLQVHPGTRATSTLSSRGLLSVQAPVRGDSREPDPSAEVRAEDAVVVAAKALELGTDIEFRIHDDVGTQSVPPRLPNRARIPSPIALPQVAKEWHRTRPALSALVARAPLPETTQASRRFSRTWPKWNGPWIKRSEGI